jgi:hypothetical protein
MTSSILSKRLTDLYREVGTLLIAFVPLDYSLQQEISPRSLAAFLAVGGMTFALSIYRENRSAK